MDCIYCNSTLIYRADKWQFTCSFTYIHVPPQNTDDKSIAPYLFVRAKTVNGCGYRSFTNDFWKEKLKIHM